VVARILLGIALDSVEYQEGPRLALSDE